MTASVADIILLLLALSLGLNLPDLDQQIPFLIHRSIITHGFLIPAAVFWAVHKDKKASSRFLSMGFNLAVATHLCFDLFPQAWRGFALIHIPIWGRSSALFSWLWISLSVIVCLYLTFILIRTFMDALLVLASLGVAFTFYASSQPTVGPPLLALLIAAVIVLILPANSWEMLRHLMLRIRRTFD